MGIVGEEDVGRKASPSDLVTEKVALAKYPLRGSGC